MRPYSPRRRDSHSRILLKGLPRATPAQLAANRANAQKSTGSRFNALKHGLDAESVIIPGEDPAAWQRLAVDHNHQFHPQSALEEFHVDTLIRCDWQKRRLQRDRLQKVEAAVDQPRPCIEIPRLGPVGNEPNPTPEITPVLRL